MRLPGFVGSAAALACFGIEAATSRAQSPVAAASVCCTLDETSDFKPKAALTCVCYVQAFTSRTGMDASTAFVNIHPKQIRVRDLAGLVRMRTLPH